MIFNVKDFGAIGDGHHDDSAAFQKALDSMVPKTGLLKDAKGGGVLLIPAGNYYLTKTLWISHRVEILGITGAEGENLTNYVFYDNPDGTCDSKVNPGAVSRLMFRRGVTGIRVATGGPNTGNGDVGSADGAAGTILRNLTIMGAFNRDPMITDPVDLKTLWLDAPINPTDFAHGISVKTRVIVENCYIFNFKGNGIHIVALANQEELPKNAVTLNNGIGFDYSIFLSLRNTNHVDIKDGDVIGGQPIIVKNKDKNGEIKPIYDLKHQALGDLNRDNAYILRGEDAGVYFNQLIRWSVITIGSRFTGVYCAYNYLNGYYTTGTNSGNTLVDRVDCKFNNGYGFFDSESSGGNTYLNCEASYNRKEGFYRLYTLVTDNTYSNKAGAVQTYINCYQEGNGFLYDEKGNIIYDANGKVVRDNLRARVYPNAIIIGGALSVSNNCEPDPDPVFKTFPTPFGGGKPAILTQAVTNAFAGFPNGINAIGGDDPRIPEANKTKVNADIGGIESGVAFSFHQIVTGEDPSYTRVSLGYQPDIEWWGMGNNFTATQRSFLFSTAKAVEGSNQFWLPNGFYIGEYPNRNKIISLNYDIGVLTEDLSKHRIGDIIFNDFPVLNDPKRGFAGYMCVVDNGEKKWAGFGKLELLP